MTISYNPAKSVATEGFSEMDELWMLTPFGATSPGALTQNSGGIGTEGDIVYTTSDGIDLNQLWAEAQAALAIWNAGRSKLVDIMTFGVVNEIESVPQVGEATFEQATEFGEPEGERLKFGYFQLAYDFEDYDRATRFTWKALRDMDSRQVQAVHNALLQADEKVIFKQVMAAIFDDSDRDTNIRNRAYKVYPLYNGDGTVPPSYRGTQFTGDHSHYLISGNETIDSEDLEDAYEHIAEHGYSIEAGTQIVCLMNRKQLKVVRTFKEGQENNNGKIASYDFIPSSWQPSQFVGAPFGLLGTLPPSTWNGLKVYGQYEDILLIEEPFIPDEYFLMFGTGGLGNLQNLVGFREHKNAIYRGLRIIPGNQQGYPLVESYYTRAFGTGIRQRGGAVVMQIGTGDTYTCPDMYSRATNGSSLIA